MVKLYPVNPVYPVKKQVLQNEPNLERILNLINLQSTISILQLPNEPILARRGYVELRHRVAPRGRSAGCACQNEPNLERILNLINLQSTISILQLPNEPNFQLTSIASGDSSILIFAL